MQLSISTAPPQFRWDLGLGERQIIRGCALVSGGAASLVLAVRVADRSDVSWASTQGVLITPDAALLILFLSAALFLRGLQQRGGQLRLLVAAPATLAILAGFVPLAGATPAGRFLGSAPDGGFVHLNPSTGLILMMLGEAALLQLLGGAYQAVLRHLSAILAATALASSLAAIVAHSIATTGPGGAQTMPMEFLAGVCFALLGTGWLVGAGGETFLLRPAPDQGLATHSFELMLAVIALLAVLADWLGNNAIGRFAGRNLIMAGLMLLAHLGATFATLWLINRAVANLARTGTAVPASQDLGGRERRARVASFCSTFDGICQARTCDELFMEACRILVERAAFPLVCIGREEVPGSLKLACYHLDPAFAVPHKDSPPVALASEHMPLSSSIKQARHHVCQDMAVPTPVLHTPGSPLANTRPPSAGVIVPKNAKTDSLREPVRQTLVGDRLPWQETATGLDLRAGAALPLFKQGRFWGTLCAFDSQPDSMDEPSLNFLCKVSQAISCALSRITLDEQRQHLDQQVRQEERRFNELCLRIPGVAYQLRIGKDGTPVYSYISPRAADFGLPTDPSHPDWKLGQFIHPDDRARFFTSVARSIMKQTNYEFEGRAQFPGGVVKWFRAAAALTVQGDELVYDGVLMDITAEKRMQAPLPKAPLPANVSVNLATGDQNTKTR